MKIAVVMSAYNCEKYVAASIESVLSQTFRDFTFYIVDDASEDTTLDILQWYEQKDDRIVILKNERNIGLTRSLNYVLQLVKEVYVARMDADDISEPNRLERQLSILEKGQHAIVGARAVLIDEDTRRLGITKKVRQKSLRRHIVFYNPIVHSSVLFELSKIKEIGCYDENMDVAQDYDLWSRLDPTSIFLSNECLVRLRLRDDSITRSKRQRQLEVHKSIVERNLSSRLSSFSTSEIQCLLHFLVSAEFEYTENLRLLARLNPFIKLLTNISWGYMLDPFWIKGFMKVMLKR